MFSARLESFLSFLPQDSCVSCVMWLSKWSKFFCLLACDLKRCEFVNDVYILYCLVFPQWGVCLVLQDVLLMCAVLFRLRPAIVLQRRHVLLLYERESRKMIQPLQIKSFEITWLTPSHYCSLCPSLPSLHLFSSCLLFLSKLDSSSLLFSFCLRLSCLFSSPVHSYGLVSSLLISSCFRFPFIVSHLTSPCFPSSYLILSRVFIFHCVSSHPRPVFPHLI